MSKPIPPEGYVWPAKIGTPVTEYLATHLFVCTRCGAAVLDTAKHDAWHGDK